MDRGKPCPYKTIQILDPRIPEHIGTGKSEDDNIMLTVVYSILGHV
jgi:hypothetical protein